MNWNRYFKTNRSKFWGLMVLFLIIIFFGGVLFTWGYLFKRRTLYLRGAYMLIAVLWVVLSIRAICIKVNFRAIWRGMVDQFYARQESYERDLDRRYQDLISRYPMAVAEYESQCWHQNPRPTNSEIKESALVIEEREWVERERAAEKKMADRNSAHK